MCFSHCHLTAPRNAAAPRSAGWSLLRTSCHDFHHDSAASIHRPQGIMIRDVYGISSPKWELLMAAYHNVRHQIDKPWLFIGVVSPPSVNWGLLYPGHDQKTMNPHCSTVLRPQRELVPSAPRHLWKSQFQKFETSSHHILRCFVWKYAHDIQLPSKKKQHRHVNSWSSFSPWFSPCFPMVFPFVHHFSPQKSGGFWDPTWTSKSRCQA